MEHRWVYYQGEKIVLISDKEVELAEGMKVLKAPPDLGVSDLNDYIIKDDKIMLKTDVPGSEMRVALISDYGINCGIATYNKYLADEIKPMVKELRIFAEENPEAVVDPTDNVVFCWKRSGDYNRIPQEIKKFNPDLIIIQHEFGLFHNQGSWGCLLSQLSRWRTIVVLHTVLEHEYDNKEARDDYTTRCLTEMACPEVIVHTPRARATLRARGYSGRVHYIPHGCFPAIEDNRLPSTKYGLYSPNSIIQYGFGGQHKGWEIAIDVVQILRARYPDIIYLGIFNISPFGGSAPHAYHQKLLDIIESKGLTNNVAIHKGFQSDEMLKNLIRCSRVAFYPYQVPNPYWASWGASGAIRLPLALGIPLVLSDYPSFQEFKGLLPLVRTPEDAAHEIDRIFSDPGYEASLRQKAIEITNQRSWPKVARWFLSCRSTEDFNAL